jgi:DNA-binding NtrC family response regulator
LLDFSSDRSIYNLGCASAKEVPVSKSILVIDDDEMIPYAIKTIFEDMGYSVSTTTDSVKGTEEALAKDYDLIITDLRMPNRNGAEVVDAVLEKKPGARLLMVTSFPTDPLAVRALKAGAIGLLKKPFEIMKILDFLR